MNFPKILGFQQAAAPASSPASSGTTSTGLAVSAGDSVYVFVSYGTNSSGGIFVSSVTDSQGNAYTRAAIIQNKTNSIYPAQEVWYTDDVPANSSLTVTVTFNSSTFFIFTATDISGVDGSGSLDAVSSGQTGNATSSSDPISIISPYDLVVACQCSQRNTGTFTSGGGFTSAFAGVSGTSLTADVSTNGWYDDASAIGSYNSKLSSPSAQPYAVITVAIKASRAWTAISGRPTVTVSSKGLANGLSALANDGADYGPDTPHTSTSGIQEAMNRGGMIRIIGDSAQAYVLGSPLYIAKDGTTIVADSNVTIQCGSSTWIHLVNDSSGNSHSWIRWVGNGAKINLNHEANVFVGDLITESSSTPPHHHLYFGGWEIYDFNGDLLIRSNDSSGGGSEQQYDDITLEDLYLHTFANVGSGNTVAGLEIAHSNVTAQRIRIDASDFPNQDHSVLIIRGGPMNFPAITENILLEEIALINNGVSGQVLEVQGNPGTSAAGITRNVVFRGCTFNSGATSPVAAGSGGPFLDDNNSVSNSSFIYNIVFDACKWINCTMTYQSTSSTFGSVTFRGTGPQGFSGSLLGRTTGPAVSVTVTASPFTYVNADGCDEFVAVTGGAVSEVTINGLIYYTMLPAVNFTIRLGGGDTMVITYTAAPTMTKIGAAG